MEYSNILLQIAFFKNERLLEKSCWFKLNEVWKILYFLLHSIIF